MTHDSSPSVAFRLGSFAFFRPGTLAVLLTVSLVGVCFALGFWQVARLQWKEQLIADLAAANEEQPLTVQELPEDVEALKALNFRKVRLSGVYMDDREFHLIGRYHNGKSGYDVLTPFYVTGTDRVLLVNRGWIPLAKKDPASRPQDVSTVGEVTINGLLMYPRAGSPFLPDHDVKGNVWFSYDTDRMNAEMQLNLPPVIVEVVDAEHPKDVLPLPREDYVVELRNDHLYYAITWFSLAFSGIVIFLLAHRIKPVAGETV